MFTGKDIDVSFLSYDPVDHDVILGMDLLFGYYLSIYGDKFILCN